MVPAVVVLVYDPEAVSVVTNKKNHVVTISGNSYILCCDALTEQDSICCCACISLIDNIVAVSKTEYICIVAVTAA